MVARLHGLLLDFVPAKQVWVQAAILAFVVCVQYFTEVSRRSSNQIWAKVIVFVLCRYAFRWDHVLIGFTQSCLL